MFTFCLYLDVSLSVKGLCRELDCSSFFASNILFWREEGYFAAAAELKPLLHTWSLAVEEQFYLLFPIFMLALWRYGRQRLFWYAIAIAGLSFIMAEWGWRKEPSTNFYLAPTRAWELLAGAACAFREIGRSQGSSNLLSSIGLALIVVPIFVYNDSTPSPSVYTLSPVVGTALVILFAAQDTWVGRLLGLPAFVGIGMISYSAYLWHQPLFAFARLRSLFEPSPTLMAILSVASLLLAWATWYWVEQPFRDRRNPLLVTRTLVFAASGAASAVFVAVGLTAVMGDGLDFRSRNGTSLAELERRVTINHGMHDDCEGKFKTSENCFTSRTPNVLLWGDSFAMHLAQGIIASDPMIEMQQHTKSVCAPVLGVAHVGPKYRRGWAKGCIGFNNRVLKWLLQNDSVEIVILSSPFKQLLSDSLLLDGGQLLNDPDISFLAKKLVATVKAIRAAGARVVIVSPTPRPGWDVGQCLMRSIYFGAKENSCNFELPTNVEAFELLRIVEQEVPVYWLHNDFCSAGVCDVMQDGVFIFRDNGHLSKEGSELLGLRQHWMEKFRQLAN